MEKITVIQLFSKDFYITSDSVSNITDLVSKNKYLCLGYVSINVSAIEIIYEKEVGIQELVLITAVGLKKIKYMKMINKLNKQYEKGDITLQTRDNELLKNYIESDHTNFLELNRNKEWSRDLTTTYLQNIVSDSRKTIKQFI